MSHLTYENPLISRYASAEMSQIWSAQKKHSTWRRLWVALAESQHEMGLGISAEQVQSLKEAVEDIDFDLAAKYEKELRHDVMAHVHTFGDRCPDSMAIIHLGATSCFVTDNSELVMIRESLERIRGRLVSVIDHLSQFAKEYRDLPCLGFTHLQPAQPTTVGKRATLWCYDLILDLEEIEYRLEKLRFRGVKGTTGTQATFLQLFQGDHAKVDELDRRVTEKMGFTDRYAVTGQTYSRKVDAQVLSALSGIGQSAHKAGNDIRILQNRKELEEPFEKKQIGSSAMAYKRNPMRSERMCSLARFAMSLTSNAEDTAATQWMERTLDDSANRRLSLPQSFLAIDAVLILYRNIVDGMVVYPKVIEKHLNEELPFMATEEFLMAGVAAGGDRQDLHELIRVHSQAAGAEVKVHGGQNDLIERLQKDPAFSKCDLNSALDARKYIGRAPEQVDAFIAEIVDPVRQQYQSDLEQGAEDLKV
ncbi:MAG: adenylosuccinate lyase [Planctomycetes bacterium]|nr:adenylosuccinate lyase [Planctomycetota bacterium]MCH9727486.1 adenylosuccinate lyase [Planctomycetota bacterium]MCH9775991.1 adenylosuccinate lyase [Planctomycetota bacterium]MCH9789480.1 adenylosuccinate lyase [Planctomycetota bacterium]